MIACETKIAENILDSELNLNECDIYRSHMNTHGGGILVARRCLRSYIIEILDLFCEHVCIQLLIDSSKLDIIKALIVIQGFSERIV